MVVKQLVLSGSPLKELIRSRRHQLEEEEEEEEDKAQDIRPKLETASDMLVRGHTVRRCHVYTLFHEMFSTFFSNIIGLPERRNKRKSVLEITKMYYF